MSFAVRSAKRKFVEREGFTFLALTKEVFPTYMLTRDINHPTAQHVMSHLLYHVPGVVEVRDFPERSLYMHKLVQVGDRFAVISSF